MLSRKVLSYYNKTQNSLSGKTIHIPTDILKKIHTNISKYRNQEIAFYLQGTLFEEKNIFNVEEIEIPKPENILDLSRIKKQTAEIVDSMIHLYQSARSELQKNGHYTFESLYLYLYSHKKINEQELEFLITHRTGISLDKIEAVSYHNGISIKKKVQNKGNHSILCHSHPSQKITDKEIAQDRQHGEGIVFYIDQHNKLQYTYYAGVKDPSPSKKRNALCNKEVAGIFNLDVAGKTPEETDQIAKAIQFSVPVLAPHIGKKEPSKIIRFNGDLSILEHLKEDGPVNYKKAIFETDSNGNYLKNENDRLVPREGAIIIDSNDTVRLKYKNTYYTLIKRSDYHMLQNPWPDKIERKTNENFITNEFLEIFKESEPKNNYLEEFNTQILQEYIKEENKYSQIITDEYSTFDEFYNILLTVPEKLAAQGLIDISMLKDYPDFIKRNLSTIQEFYERPKDIKKSYTYEIKNEKRKNIPIQMLVDLMQEISTVNSAGAEIIGNLQKVYTLKDISSQNRIITKIKIFAEKNNLDNLQIIRILLLTLCSHDPHTALEHSVEMANLFKNFLEFLTEESIIKILGREIKPQEKNDLILGFILHDIGKIFISTIMLRKKGPVWDTDRVIDYNSTTGKQSEQEYITDKHTLFGKKIIKLFPKINNIEIVKNTAHYHHPRNNKLPNAKNKYKFFVDLCILFDVYNALISERGYKKAKEIKTILNNIMFGEKEHPDLVSIHQETKLIFKNFIEKFFSL